MAASSTVGATLVSPKQGETSLAPTKTRRAKSKSKIKDTILIFSQVFIPDPASVGQHIADVAFELVRRGYRVRVYTSRRGYDDPTQKYPKREFINGVDVRRLPFSSFGKKSTFTRILARPAS